jgi:hypothetical protein
MWICLKVRLSRLAVKRNAIINRFGTPKCKDSKFSSMSVMLLTINTTFLIMQIAIILIVAVRFVQVVFATIGYQTSNTRSIVTATNIHDEKCREKYTSHVCSLQPAVPR